MKVQILLLYFERSNLIRNALQSIKEMNYDNWELAFFDDGSVNEGEPIVREILENHLDKIRFFNTYDSIEEKTKRRDSHVGLYMNYAVVTSDAEIVVVLCDDDAITPEYFNGIERFYSQNPNEVWAYCHVIRYDPTAQDYHTVLVDSNDWYNRYITAVNPACALDSSQVSYRSKCTKKEGIYWNFPQTGALDANIFEKMQNKYGPCGFVGCVGQYKAVFPDQMGKRNTYMPNVL